MSQEIRKFTVVTPCSRGPVDTLIDYLEAGTSLGEFLDHFPLVRREQAVAALEILRNTLLAE